MEIKVGQWVRRKSDNVIFEIYPTFKMHYDAWENKQSCQAYEFTKVANTPQELIEVGDLVETQGEPVSYEEIYEPKYIGVIETIDLEFNQICCSGGCILSLEDIIKILTPNKNGDYIKQWEANNEN